jgi:hypothetical protein
LFSNGDGVLSYQHSDVAVVERDSMYLDDDIVGTKIFLLR